MGSAVLRFSIPQGQFLRPQHGRLHGVAFDRHVRDRAHDLLLILNRLHVSLRGNAGSKQADLFSGRDYLRSGARGPSSVSSEVPDKTSSMSFLIADISGSWPLMARFSRKPVISRRLISFVPSKMRLTRTSR